MPMRSSPPPTKSPPAEPTRLLAAETVPVPPLLPLPHVAAPRPPFTAELAATCLPLVSAVTPALPTRSLALLPTRLLAAETVPTTPLPPLPHVTAPRPPFQPGLTTT